MSDKFKFETVVKSNRKTILLKGFIDEDTSFTPLSQEAGPLYINFSELQGINSCGIRSWVNFLKDMGGKPVFFEECPPVVVRQMNMVPSFTGHAEVLSVFVPYVCENCDQEKTVLINQENWKAGKINIPETVPCESCKQGEMELDGNPQQYFAFRR